MKKILFVSHCILNTASKVVLYNQADIDAEEDLRVRFLIKAVQNGVQLVQLPCPEFTLYGSQRWGHVSNQFDNIFFRNHCRKILQPIIDQMKEYLQHGEMFEVLGVVGIDGSPSCGVDYTCEANWFGSFEGRTGLQETLDSCVLVKKSGIFMQVLKDMISEEQLQDKIKISSLFAPEPEKCLNMIQ